MRLEIGHDAHHEGRARLPCPEPFSGVRTSTPALGLPRLSLRAFASLGLEQTQGLDRRVMSAEHHVRRELLDVAREEPARLTGEYSPQPVQARRQFGIVGLVEHQPPELRGMLHDGEVPVGMDFAMQRGKELHHVDGVQHVRRPEGAPSFRQGRRRRHVATPRRRCRYQYAHGFRIANPPAACLGAGVLERKLVPLGDFSAHPITRPPGENNIVSANPVARAFSAARRRRNPPPRRLRYGGSDRPPPIALRARAPLDVRRGCGMFGVVLFKYE